MLGNEAQPAEGARSLLGSLLPERRLTVDHDGTTQTVRLSPRRQAALFVAVVCGVGWLTYASGALVMAWIDTERQARDLALIEETYATRLAALEAQRTAALTEAEAARTRFTEATAHIAGQQDELVAALDAERAQRVTLEAVRRKLADAVRARDDAERKRAALADRLANVEGDLSRQLGTETDLSDTLGAVSIALADTIAQREAAEARIAALNLQLGEIEARDRLADEKLQRLFGRLEEAVIVSLGRLEGALAPTGLDINNLVAQMRSTYSGEGGPFIAVDDAALESDDPASMRVAALMRDLEQIQLMRVATRKLPLAIPVNGTYRFTSGFGTRRDPFNGRTRQHNGIDLAGDRGTPIVATADGTVIFAGRMRGYGKIIKIQHAFGVETLYAHLHRIRVKVGDTVSQGDLIGDMGNTGRSTGTHLHYEVRVNGIPVNPMRYVKAARDVL
ncbi:MAG: DUF5930 domain-containing protein [Pseudomonadota bacterium]